MGREIRKSSKYQRKREPVPRRVADTSSWTCSVCGAEVHVLPTLHAYVCSLYRDGKIHGVEREAS